MFINDEFSDVDFMPTLSDDATMAMIEKEFSDLVFSFDYDLSDLDADDVHRENLSDPDDDPDLEVTLEQCPFDIDELLDEVY